MRNFERLTYWCGLVLAIALLMVTCDGWRKDNLRNRANLEASRDSTRHFKNRLGVETATKQALLLDYGQMESLYLEKDAQVAAMAKEFAKVRSVQKIKTNTTLPTVAVPFLDPVSCDFVRRDTLKAKWFRFKYCVDQHGLEIDSLQVKATASIVTGIKRKWFLGKETVATDVTFDNPYVHVQALESALVVQKTPWYRKWYVWAAAGFAGGLLMK